MTTATIEIGTTVIRANLPSWHKIDKGVVIGLDGQRAQVQWEPTFSRPNGVKTWVKLSGLIQA